MKFFCLPNLATDKVEVITDPWNFKVPESVLNLKKDDYKKRWFNPETKHCLYLLASGQNEEYAASAGNQAALLYGFTADYDGIFTEDLISSLEAKPQSRFLPSYWCLSQSKKLHLVWMFERPIPVTGNAHANKLLKIIATKTKAPKWGVGYDPSCEDATQVMDIGREWHEFSRGCPIPAAEIVAWDFTIFEKSVKGMVQDVVDIDLKVVAEEVSKRQWPHRPPANFEIGTRCVRFWDAGADNQTGAQIVKDGIRVYTPHDNGFKSWRSLLGAEFCEQYTAKSMAPFIEDTTYCHSKDEYWRFFRNDKPPHYEKRTEKVLRRDLKKEAKLSDKPAKGEELSEIEQTLYAISRKNCVDAVAPVIYRPAGRIFVDGIGSILNTSLVTVCKPAPRLVTVTSEDLARYPNAPEKYKEDPTVCAWDNPFAVEKFPHIHHLLTAFFIEKQSHYDSWERDGFRLHDERGASFMPLFDRQLVHLLSWLSHFYVNAARMLQNPGRGQALILAGATGTGKSFFGSHILGRLFGGAVPADEFYLKGARFNSGIVSSPVHLIDDKLGSKTQKERLRFTEALKIVVANATMRHEAKFGNAVEAVPWPGRVVILANEDAQSLSVMPDLDISTRDKFMMLKLGGAKFGWGTFSENMKWLEEELPYFARFLLGWRIPVAIRDERFGVAAMQHSMMAQASAENGLTQVTLEVLETCIEHVTGTHDDEDRTDAEGFAIEGNAVKIFKWIQSVDPALGREVIDSRTLQQTLSTLHRNGAYNIVLDETTKRWKIPYVLRKKVQKGA